MTRVDVADCVAWAEAYDGPPFHALLCDPPYELGFMGRAWDRSGVAFNPDTWRALARVLHPGAFGMAFASSRGWHRLAVAIEDAGLTIHPSIFGWAFGSGFPKATRIDTQVDKAAGAERPPAVDRWAACHPNPHVNGYSGNMHINTPTAPATPLAAAWAGHRYGLQALKPALEPIIVFQKPYAGRPVDSITATGAGALNVDGGRVPTGAQDVAEMTGRSGRSDSAMFGGQSHEGWRPTMAGRWPANLVVCHTPSCNGTCAPGCPVAALGAQGGERAGAHGGGTRGASGIANGKICYGNLGERVGGGEHDAPGSPARFYHNPDFALDIAERLAAAEPVRYVAKASRRERNAGCEGLPERRGGMLGNEAIAALRRGDHAPTGAEGVAIGVGAMSRNPHPTVKPLTLARHLATLLLPPDAYAPRRLFVPFAGSGSECIGGMLAGWDEVVGVELSDEYAEIARARLAWWEANRPADAPTQLPLAVNE